MKITERHLPVISLCSLITILSVLFWGCKKYQDPPPQNLGLTNPYCNNPKAVNYNWGFPGVPVDSVCIFPVDELKGIFTYYDSILDASGVYLPFDTTNIIINKITDSTINIDGLCSTSQPLSAKVTRNLRFYTDSTNSLGTIFCNPTDTINGRGTKARIGDTIIGFNYNIFNTSGSVIHKGILIRK
jgi:hypothetical protein